MKKLIYFLILLIPIFNYSQEIKKSDLIGEWKFKEMILISESLRDSMKSQLQRVATFEDKYFESIIEPSDFKLTEDKFYYKNNDSKFVLGSDYWTFSSDNEIIVHDPVDEDKLDHFIKYTFNVIEKLDNGKYYFQNPGRMKIISLENGKMVTTDLAYNFIFERN